MLADIPNLIRVGQEILISGTGSSESASEPELSGDPFVRSGRGHVVQKSDTVHTIASQYQGISAEDIIRTNGIINEKIYVGTFLFLDGPGYVDEGEEGEIVYRVRTGDRLGDIQSQPDTCRPKAPHPHRYRLGVSGRRRRLFQRMGIPPRWRNTLARRNRPVRGPWLARLRPGRR